MLVLLLVGVGCLIGGLTWAAGSPWVLVGFGAALVASILWWAARP